MADKKEEVKTVELWEGKVVTVTRPELLKDFDFISDLTKAAKENDVQTIANMYFVLIGGESVFNEVREHIIAKKGIFDIDELTKVLKNIQDAFPKELSPAQKRW